MPLSPPEELLDFCRKTLDDPTRGTSDLVRIGLAGDAERLYELLAQLLPDTPDPDLALVHLERYCRDSAPPPDAEALQVLLALFGFSPYLGESLINDRAYLADLRLARRRGSLGVEEFRSQLARWVGVASGEDPWDALRTFKRRSTMRVALRDLQRRAALPEVCRELSSAADALIQAGLDLVMGELLGRFGRPQTYDESGRIIEAGMAVIALGKLGGMELNYSSDIDLLFIYSSDGETTGLAGRPETQITNKEFFTKGAESLARGLSLISAEGRVFRVDCRLRPGGRDGDLVNTLQGALVYYRTWARPWERQSLIKARPCAGDLHLGGRLLSEIEGIVYSRSPDPGVIQSVREMKDRIDADLARRGEGTRNLKLGVGGIREIEFTIQALQLLHGGEETWIREANTLLGLHRLSDKGYLSISEYGTLSSAYTFLREVEHRLQLHRNLQRSVLPSAAREQRVLARCLGYRDSTHRQEASRLMADLDGHRTAVRAIYDSVLGRLSQVRLEESPSPDPFLDPMPDSETAAVLAAAGLHDPEALLGSVKAIARLLADSLTAPGDRREFRRLARLLLKELSGVNNPLRALRNLERFLASLALDKAQLGDLLARPEVVPPLVRLFAGSQPLTSNLIQRPALVLEEGFGLAVARDRSVEDHLARIIPEGGSPPDQQAFAASLRIYQRNQILYVGLKDLNRQAGPAAVARALSDLAEAIVRAAVVVCARDTGWPVSQVAHDITTPGFFVLALGKLGYREIDYSSDLDLVFLYDADQGQVAERHAAANRLAGLIMETLTSITREGSLYAVDVRLRPFGREGELAQPVGHLRQYFASTAGVWEMQSFLKARPIAGDLERAWETTRETEAFLLARASEVDLPGAVRAMKTRLEQEAQSRGRELTDIKMGPGGLNAIQFAIQFLQLRNQVASPPHKRTARLLATLKASGLLDEEAYRVFFTGFQFLRRLEHQLRLIHGRALSRLPASREAMEEIALAMGYGPHGSSFAGSRLLDDLALHQQRIEATYKRVIEKAVLHEAVEA